jgi:hypothetical protein
VNLWEVQPWVAELVSASPALPDDIILQDDGTYPKTPQREELLRTKGLVLIVWQIESEGLGDVSAAGLAKHDLYVPVVVEENVKVNRAAGGTGIVAEKALQYVLSACTGKRPSATSTEVLLPMDPPFKNFGTVNGVRRIVANFVLGTTIKP